MVKITLNGTEKNLTDGATHTFECAGKVLSATGDLELYFSTPGYILSGDARIDVESGFRTLYCKGKICQRNITIGEGLYDPDPYVTGLTLENGQLSLTYSDKKTRPSIPVSVNSDNVIFTKEILTPFSVGAMEMSGGLGKIAKEDESLQVREERLWESDKNPTKTAPKMNLYYDGISRTSYEVGSIIEIPYKVTFEHGKYSYGPATGVKFDGFTVTSPAYGSKKKEEHKYTIPTGKTTWHIDKDGDNKDYEDTKITANNGETVKAKFTSFTAKSTINNAGVETCPIYYISGSANHSEGAVPLTLKGESCTTTGIRITKGTVYPTSPGNITVYRNSYYGTLDYLPTFTDSPDKSKDEEDISDILKSMYNGNNLGTSGRTLSKGAKFDIDVKVGAKRVVIAYPAHLDGDSGSITTVLDNDTNYNINTSFERVKLKVKGAGADKDYDDSIDYHIYYFDFGMAGGNNDTNTFSIEI